MAFPVAKQQVCISPTCSIQKTFHRLEKKNYLVTLVSWLTTIPVLDHFYTLYCNWKYKPYLLQQAKGSNAISGVPGQDDSFQQAAQGRGQRVYGKSRRDGMKMLLQVCHALVIDLSHIICSPCLLLLWDNIKSMWFTDHSPWFTMHYVAIDEQLTFIGWAKKPVGWDKSLLGKKPGMFLANSSYTASCLGSTPPTYNIHAVSSWSFTVSTNMPNRKDSILFYLTASIKKGPHFVPSYLKSDLLWHTFSLVSQNNRIAITTSLLTCVLSQFKFLQSSRADTVQKLDACTLMDRLFFYHYST